MVDTLSNMIKPAAPTQHTRDLISGNARNWGDNTYLILMDHYEANLAEYLDEVSGLLIQAWKTSFEVAVRWARRNLLRITRDEIDHAQALITARVDTMDPAMLQVPQQTIAKAQTRVPQQATASTDTRDLACGHSPQQTAATAETHSGHSIAQASPRDEMEGRAVTPLQPTTKRAVATMTDSTGQQSDWHFDCPYVEPPRELRVGRKCLRKTKHLVLNEDDLPRDDLQELVGKRTPVGDATLLDLSGLFVEITK